MHDLKKLRYQLYDELASHLCHNVKMYDAEISEIAEISIEEILHNCLVNFNVSIDDFVQSNTINEDENV